MADEPEVKPSGEQAPKPAAKPAKAEAAPAAPADEGLHAMTIDGAEVKFTQEQHQEYVRDGMRSAQVRKALEMRERKVTGSEDDFARYQAFQSALANDPGKSVEMVKQFATEAGWTGPEEGSGGADLEDLDPNVRALMQRVQRIEAGDRQRDQVTQRRDMEGKLNDVTQGFDLYKGDTRAQKLFGALVAAGLAQSPNSSAEQVAHLVDTEMRHFVEHSMSQAREAREEADNNHRGPAPGSGAPDLTPPETPFTQEDMKAGTIKDRVADLFRGIESAAGGPT